LQDTKNRQNSLKTDDQELILAWNIKQQEILNLVEEYYNWAIVNGIAKECARVILPEGNTMSRLYVNGTLRSWLHYVEVRTEAGVTQQEHVELARMVASVIAEAFPQISNFVKE
jgi:thymidylate synthase (FAD)